MTKDTAAEDPAATNLDARIRRRWEELVTAADAAGVAARHCHGATCFQGEQDVSVCECACDGCDLAATLLVEAEREIRGA